MFQQIVTQTPIYVWAILGFLVYRGMVASKNRTVTYRSVFIIPVVMLVLGMQSIAAGFGMASAAGAAWIAAMAAGAAFTARRSGSDIDRASGMVHLRGSWAPLALMMAVFCCKYAVAVTLAVQPALRGDLRFAVPACIVLGLLNGAFLGRLLGTVSAWNRTIPATVSIAVS